MFDLEQEIAAWRRDMLKAGIKTPVPLDELEIHLRDEIEQQVRSGSGEQPAFDTAVQRVGRAGTLRREFAKIGGARQVLRRKTVWAVIGLTILGCWIIFGHSPALALVYSVLLTGLIVAALIDLKHLIIPDEITIGGILLGLLCSALLPSLHGQDLLRSGMLQSLLGIAAGAGLAYFVLRAGKLAFGRQRLVLSDDTKIIFSGGALLLPETEIPYAEIFYRKSDAIALQARTVEIAGRSYRDVPVRLTPGTLQIGNDKFDPEAVTRMEAVSTEIVLPREAMGLGDVKFLAAIGAFLGWQA